MTDPTGAGADWLTLLLVGVPGTLLASVTLAVVLLDRAKSMGSRDGQEGADVHSIGSQVSALSDGLKGQASALQQHLIECAKNQGRLEASSKAVDDTLKRLDNSVAGLNRTVANWMRDRERAGP